MQFIPNGPSIPDELLVARDAGDVIFFCGAGVSQHEADLPNFERLGRNVIDILGAALDAPARLLLTKALEMGRMAGVGGLLATDRVFGLLERDFEVADVRAAVAEAITPKAGAGLGAHRTLLTLATSRAGVTRLVTTNFDLLFEACDPSLACSGPPRLPDPRSDQDFRGIVHLHGRVDPHYRRPADEEFVVSSADFGRAYLSDGWATRFIQSLLARFQIVFVGYTAEDPPVQYLLEALNLQPGTRKRLYAFQDGESEAAKALWEHKGVQAIPFDSSNGFGPLWDTLAAWANRASDIERWYDGLLAKAQIGPMALDPHTRAQIGEIMSTSEGARRFATAEMPLDARWLLAFDPAHRFASPDHIEPHLDETPMFDPFSALGLATDPVPDPDADGDHMRHRNAPNDALDVFAVSRSDVSGTAEGKFAGLRGSAALEMASLPPRLNSLGIWLQRIAHQPIALWWAGHQGALHPDVVRSTESWLRQDPNRFPEPIRQQWRWFFAARADVRPEPDRIRYELEARSQREGWSPSLVRTYVDLFKPQLTVSKAYGVRHPLFWEEPPEKLVHVDVEYPRPHDPLEVPGEHLAYAISILRGHLELAISLEQELTGDDYLHFEHTRPDDGGAALGISEYGIRGPIAMFIGWMARLQALDPAAARAEFQRWSTDDRYVFARLRIWAAANRIIDPDEGASSMLSLSDELFWSTHHQRDLLYAIRDLWPDLSAASRTIIEQRLLTTTYPWSGEIRSEPSRAEAHYRLSRLHWLVSQGVTFGFDVDAEQAKLRALDPEWTPVVGDHTADSHAPEVYSIETDTTPDAILETPIPDILAAAREAGGRADFFSHIERDPFRGLADARPLRALAALTHVARSGEAPPRAWSAFLNAETRLKDSVRMVALIAGRLRLLPPSSLLGIASPLSDWMERIKHRLYGDAAAILPELWDRIVEALAIASDTRPHRPDQSWADDALNAPVGRLAQLLLADPMRDSRVVGGGFPEEWTRRADQLLNLPGDRRRHALVMLGTRYDWFFNVDPGWTEYAILPAICGNGADADAVWDGIYWTARTPTRAAFALIKPGLIAQARQGGARRKSNDVISGMLLGGWGGEADAAEPERMLTDIELREVLIHADDELRGQFLWHLGHWSNNVQTRWPERLVPFLRTVWPKQRALRNPSVSSRLVDLALGSGDQMPAVVEVILPRLVPTRSTSMHMMLFTGDGSPHPAYRYPAALLDLLWAVLGDDVQQWPYKIEEALDRLGEDPVVGSDPRLAELRRRLQR
ncbi:SIR2 family protein [Sphingomonas sp. BAUL-RG-20F-R05-02]|uniref:SIR2 family protein n=1 Tax=Sphingomonas sp. BAUL-RG-20F-R05-02 TaxID=2914830 RepID=UPI001F580CD8|nr:SIR2 family protein [Sphingomonas sp. BAUL-RG-20F-R05-02]